MIDHILSTKEGSEVLCLVASPLREKTQVAMQSAKVATTALAQASWTAQAVSPWCLQAAAEVALNQVASKAAEESAAPASASAREGWSLVGLRVLFVLLVSEVIVFGSSSPGGADAEGCALSEFP